MLKAISKFVKLDSNILQMPKNRLGSMNPLTFPGVIKLTPQAEKDLLEISQNLSLSKSDLATFQDALKLVEKRGGNALISNIKHLFIPHYDETLLKLTINGKEMPISTKNIYNDGLKQKEKIAAELLANI